MWTCEKCGETHEEQFASCWKCGNPQGEVHEANCRCATCQCELKDEETAYGFSAPDYCLGIPEEERSARINLSPDLCTIDEEHFFIAGNLSIQVIGASTAICITCWVSLSRASFHRVQDEWLAEGREHGPPLLGWFSNQIPGYPETMNLKAKIRTMPVGIRPIIELEPTDHPLSHDQRQGVSPERARLIKRQLESHLG